MLSKNNLKERIRRQNTKKQRFAIRKLTVGVASVLIGFTFIGMQETVHADTAVADTVTTDTTNSDQQPNAEDLTKSSNDNEISSANKTVGSQQPAETQANLTISNQSSPVTPASQLATSLAEDRSVANVGNYAEFSQAIMDANVHTIHLTNDIDLTQATDADAKSVPNGLTKKGHEFKTNLRGIARQLTIDGFYLDNNGKAAKHQLSFGANYLSFYDSDYRDGHAWNLIVKDVELLANDIDKSYGPFYFYVNASNAEATTLTFDNIQADLQGTSLVNSYKPVHVAFSGVNVINDQLAGDYDAVNAISVTVNDGANVRLTVNNTNIPNNSWHNDAFYMDHSNSFMKIGSGAQLSITSTTRNLRGIMIRDVKNSTVTVAPKAIVKMSLANGHSEAIWADNLDIQTGAQVLIHTQQDNNSGTNSKYNSGGSLDFYHNAPITLADQGDGTLNIAKDATLQIIRPTGVIANGPLITFGNGGTNSHKNYDLNINDGATFDLQDGATFGKGKYADYTWPAEYGGLEGILNPMGMIAMWGVNSYDRITIGTARYFNIQRTGDQYGMLLRMEGNHAGLNSGENTIRLVSDDQHSINLAQWEYNNATKTADHVWQIKDLIMHGAGGNTPVFYSGSPSKRYHYGDDLVSIEQAKQETGTSYKNNGGVLLYNENDSAALEQLKQLFNPWTARQWSFQTPAYDIETQPQAIMDTDTTQQETTNISGLAGMINNPQSYIQTVKDISKGGGITSIDSFDYRFDEATQAWLNSNDGKTAGVYELGINVIDKTTGKTLNTIYSHLIICETVASPQVYTTVGNVPNAGKNAESWIPHLDVNNLNPAHPVSVDQNWIQEPDVTKVGNSSGTLRVSYAYNGQVIKQALVRVNVTVVNTVSQDIAIWQDDKLPSTTDFLHNSDNATGIITVNSPTWNQQPAKDGEGLYGAGAYQLTFDVQTPAGLQIKSTNNPVTGNETIQAVDYRALQGGHQSATLIIREIPHSDGQKTTVGHPLRPSADWITNLHANNQSGIYPVGLVSADWSTVDDTGETVKIPDFTKAGVYNGWLNVDYGNGVHRLVVLPVLVTDDSNTHYNDDGRWAIKTGVQNWHKAETNIAMPIKGVLNEVDQYVLVNDSHGRHYQLDENDQPVVITYRLNSDGTRFVGSNGQNFSVDDIDVQWGRNDGSHIPVTDWRQIGNTTATSLYRRDNGAVDSAVQDATGNSLNALTYSIKFGSKAAQLLGLTGGGWINVYANYYGATSANVPLTVTKVGFEYDENGQITNRKVTDDNELLNKLVNDQDLVQFAHTLSWADTGELLNQITNAQDGSTITTKVRIHFTDDGSYLDIPVQLVIQATDAERFNPQGTAMYMWIDNQNGFKYSTPTEIRKTSIAFRNGFAKDNPSQGIDGIYKIAKATAHRGVTKFSWNLTSFKLGKQTAEVTIHYPDGSTDVTTMQVLVLQSPTLLRYNQRQDSDVSIDPEKLVGNLRQGPGTGQSVIWTHGAPNTKEAPLGILNENEASISIEYDNEGLQLVNWPKNNRFTYSVPTIFITNHLQTIVSKGNEGTTSVEANLEDKKVQKVTTINVDGQKQSFTPQKDGTFRSANGQTFGLKESKLAVKNQREILNTDLHQLVNLGAFNTNDYTLSWADQPTVSNNQLRGMLRAELAPAMFINIPVDTELMVEPTHENPEVPNEKPTVSETDREEPVVDNTVVEPTSDEVVTEHSVTNEKNVVNDESVAERQLDDGQKSIPVVSQVRDEQVTSQPIIVDTDVMPAGHKDSSNGIRNGNRELPQTGQQNQIGWVTLGITGLLAMFGLTTVNRKRNAN